MIRFTGLCERDPALVLDHVKTLLAHGGKPRELAEQWNSGIAPFLLEAGVDRKTAIGFAIDRVINKFLGRDGCITGDTARFVGGLFNRATGSKQALKRVLADIEKRTETMLAEPPAWPLEKERLAQIQAHVLEQKTVKKPFQVPRYRNTENSEFCVLTPAENRG